MWGEFTFDNNRSTLLPHWVMDGISFQIDIWELNTTDPINVKATSYKNRPTRNSKLTSILIKRGSITVSESFRCPTDKLLSFEFSCASEFCMLDLWQDRADYDLGQYGISLSSLKILIYH